MIERSYSGNQLLLKKSSMVRCGHWGNQGSGTVFTWRRICEQVSKIVCARIAVRQRIHSPQSFQSSEDRGMVVERMVDGALGNKRGYYDGRYACSVLSEVKPQGVPCFLSLRNPITGRNGAARFYRSEERRVGKECRSRWSTYHEKKKK